MDFLDAFDGYDQPYRMTLKHPATGEPIVDADGAKAYIDIYAPTSVKAKEWNKARFIEAKKDAKKNKKPEPTYEEAQEKGASWFATLTAGWYLVNPKTGEGDAEFTFEKAVGIYADHRAAWIIGQINDALEDDSNFLTPQTA